MKFSSLATLEVVILTTSSVASNENFIKMKTFLFQCNIKHKRVSNFGVVILTTLGETSDENIIKIKSFPLQFDIQHSQSVIWKGISWDFLLVAVKLPLSSTSSVDSS